MRVFKRKQLEGKAHLYVGDRNQYAVGINDGRWYYTLDNETYIGVYKRRILAERAYRAHNTEGFHVG